MKKNIMMRLASFLLVAVLISTSAISGTYAKYVTEGTGTDSARVAKWGVTVTAEGTTFAEKYETHDGSASVGTHSVVATEDVVAPGTSKEMAHVALTGTPEVAVKVTYSADLALSTNWTAGGSYYCPLKITVCGTTLDGKDYDSTAAFEEAVEGLIASWSKQYKPNTDLSKVTADDLVVSWEWPFSTSEENDVKDTALGNQAVVGNPATVALTVTCTVTQID